MYEKMKTITIRGAQWHYKELNPDQQETILLVHGHPFDHSMWTYQYEALNAFRLILPDLKGYGQTAPNCTEIYLEEQALDLALLLDELAISKVHLIGLSMGGQIIVEFSRLFPNRVKSLIICASTPSGESKEGYQHRMNLAGTISKLGMIEYTQSDIHKYLNLDEVGRDSSVYQHLYTMMTSTTAQGAVASHRGRAKRRDNMAYLSQIRVPTLVIAGEQDFFFSIEKVRRVADQIPQAQFLSIAKAGHLPNMENPERFNAAVIAFFRSIGL